MSVPATSFKLLHEAGACKERYKYLAKKLGGVKQYGKDTPITICQILNICGLDDALWALRACPGHDRFKCILCIDYAEHILPLAEIVYRDNGKIRSCLHLIRDFVNTSNPPLEHFELPAILKFIEKTTKEKTLSDRNSKIVSAMNAGACLALYAARLTIEKVIAVYKVHPIYRDNCELVAEADWAIARDAQDAAAKIGQGEDERRWQILHLTDLLVQFYGQEAQKYE